MIRVQAQSGGRFNFDDEVNWQIDDHGRLHIFQAVGGQINKGIASFAPDEWRSVCRTSAKEATAS